MSDSEIIKALECCQTNDESKCVDCPYCDDCIEKNNVVADTLDLINRQKEEIERLKRSLDNMTDALIRTDDYCRDLECKGGKDNG